MKSTVKYIIPILLFICSFKLYLKIYSFGESNLGKELIRWMLLKEEYAVGHFLFFGCLHELKWSNISWHTLCFLSPFVYITSNTVLIFSSSHTKPHQGRPQTLKKHFESDSSQPLNLHILAFFFIALYKLVDLNQICI